MKVINIALTENDLKTASKDTLFECLSRCIQTSYHAMEATAYGVNEIDGVPVNSMVNDSLHTIAKVVNELDRREEAEESKVAPAPSVSDPHQDIVDNYAAARLGMFKDVPWDVEKIAAERKAMVKSVENNTISISKCAICGEVFQSLTSMVPSIDGDVDKLICEHCSSFCH